MKKSNTKVEMDRDNARVNNFIYITYKNIKNDRQYLILAHTQLYYNSNNIVYIF